MRLFRKATTTVAASPSSDPALDELHRSMAAIDAQPQVTPASADELGDVHAAAVWMRQTYDAGDRRAVWNRRLELGGSFAQGTGSSGDWFWANALAALSAMDLGLRDHPLVATCCGFADVSADRSNPQEMAAKAEFNRRYFS